MNNLKQVNDRYGRGGGDTALRHLATAMQKRTRESDILARFGGDEFAIALPECSKNQAESVAKDILEATNQPLTIQEDNGAQEITISSSIGIATHNTTDTPEDVLARR